MRQPDGKVGFEFAPRPAKKTTAVAGKATADAVAPASKPAAPRARDAATERNVYELKPTKAKQAPASGQAVAGRGSSVIQAGAPGMGGSVNQPRVNEANEENPSLVLWQAKDSRLQSQQIVQEAADRAFNYLASYRIGDNKFVRLSDTTLRTVNVFGRDRAAYGIDTRAYDQPASYNGRRYEDFYSVDLATGSVKKLGSFGCSDVVDIALPPLQ